MTNPRLLLLDEVSLGLAPIVVEGVYRSLATLIEAGTTVLLVEQDLARAMSVADRVVCMLEGRIVLEGLRGELTREQVTAAYFGLDRRGHRVTWVSVVIHGMLLGGVYALLASGLSLMFGVMRIINLAHGSLALVGAFMALLLTEHLAHPLDVLSLAVVLPGA